MRASTVKVLLFILYLPAHKRSMLLKMPHKVTMYQKISALIILSGLIFTGFCFAIYYYTLQQEREVYNTSKAHFKNEVNSLIELNTNTNVSNIIDMVYWDEFVDYIKTRNQHWFNENITSSVDTYKADYLGIYDVDGNFIDKSSTNKIKVKDLVPKAVFEKLSKKRLLKFYLKIPKGYVEIYGASIHHTADIYEKISKPEGFFFIAKLLDQAYFENLERINNSKIGLYNSEIPNNTKNLYVIEDLKNWKGAVLTKVSYVRPFDVSFGITKNILILLIVIYIISIIIFLTLSRRWIYKPVKLITSILEKENENDMESLKDIPGEFSYIGTLLKEKNDQRLLLESAKAKAEESDRLKSSFLTNISHEIRTPMNAIVGFSDLLLNSEIKEQEKYEYAEIINKSGASLVSIIDDLIEMSKIDTNQVSPNYSSVDINACIEELHQTIAISIPKHKKLDFKILKPKNGLCDNIITDVVKLRQILTNLITNAIKYTPEGFVSFGYELDSHYAELRFTVSDSGIGIDPENHSMVFDRFHRIENDFTIKAGGLGLGLAISKAYVQMLGGRISVASQVMKGTSVTFTIPVKYDKKADASFRVAPEVKIQTNEKPISILVAEDDNINFLLIQKMLHLNKLTIIRAKDGQEAVDICRQREDLDIVLMDIKMPVLDGYQAYEQIKQFRPDIPVIAQTAYASSEDEIKIRKFGFKGYISKPINKEKLLEIINRVMDLKV